MKRVGRKIIVFIFTVVMCLGILPAGVQKTMAATTISSIQISGLVGTMKDGTAQKTLADVHYGGAGYQATTLFWQKEDFQLGLFKDMSSTEKFQKGNHYQNYAEFRITPTMPKKKLCRSFSALPENSSIIIDSSA